jgi:hypothetical protein
VASSCCGGGDQRFGFFKGVISFCGDGVWRVRFLKRLIFPVRGSSVECSSMWAQSSASGM